MENILGVEEVNKLEGMDLSMLAKYVQDDLLNPMKQCNQTNPVKGNRLIPQQLLDLAKDL